MLTKHMEDEVHLLAMKNSIEAQLVTSEKERESLKARAKQQFNVLHEPVARMVRTVITEVLTEMPLGDHKQIVDMQVQNGVTMGNLYRSKYGARKIVEVVSATMHKNLLQYLKDQDKPLSLIVDATTNTQNIPYLVCFFMSLEDNQPISYFYKLLELSEGEGSRATFATFMNQINADNEVVPGFKTFFKNRLRYVASDSAAVMVGVKQSFLTELKAELRRDIANIGCYAHKLSLVLKAALRDPKDPEIKVITNFEKNLNDLYVFYQARGSKRFQHLSETATEFDIKPVRFKQNHLVRWAAAEERVIDAILRNRDIAVKDLEMIAADKAEYPAPTRQKAQYLFEYLSDISLSILTNEFADLLSINKALSLTLQERAGTLFDHANSIQQTLQQYRELKDTHGSKVSEFLKGCECTGVCQKPICTMRQLEDCQSPVLCNGGTYERKILTSEKIYSIRTHLYDKIVVAMNSYFNFELIEAMLIFDNRRYITEKSSISSTKMDQSFGVVCKFMKHSDANCKLLQHDFQDLYRGITENANTMKEIENAPSLFWPFVMESMDVKVTQRLKSFFEELLVLPDSSAEAERGFSVLTRLQRGARSKLTPDITDSLMRIRINGAKPLADLKIYEYTTELLKVMGSERTQPAEESKKRSMKSSRLF